MVCSIYAIAFFVLQVAGIPVIEFNDLIISKIALMSFNSWQETLDRLLLSKKLLLDKGLFVLFFLYLVQIVYRDLIANLILIASCYPDKAAAVTN